MRVVVVAALIACAMTALCVAEEEADVKKVAEEVKAEVPPREEDQEMQTGEAPRRAANDYSHPNVKVTAMIPDYLGKEIPAGEEVEMIVWFANAAETPMKLHGIFAALQSSMDASRFIQNFTPRALDVVVESNTEASVSYKFAPSEYLTAMPYRLFSVIEYSDARGQRYFNVLFNETLGFAEANVAFDVELIMTYLIIIGTIVGSIYGIYLCFTKKTTKGKSKSAAKPTEEVPHEENEWLIGTSAHEHMKKQKKEKKN